MTISAEHERTWAQPRYATARDESRESLGADVGLVAEQLGWPLLPWQQQVVDVASELTPDGRWAYPVVVLTVMRQVGKTALVFATMAQRAIRLEDHRSAFAAQTGQEGRRLFRQEWAPRVESRMPRRWKVRRSNGEESLTWPATNGSVRPFPPVPGALHSSQSDMAVIDEGWKHDLDLGASLLQAAVPTQTTRRRRQLWLVSTAGPPESLWFRQWVERGRNAEQGMAYFEWSAPADADMDDPAVWAAAHPALGELVTVDDLRDFRRTMGEGFARAYMNVWPDMAESQATHQPPMTTEAWDACADRHGKITGRPVFAADVDVLTHTGVIVACGPGERGMHVEVIQTDAGTMWLPDRLIDLAGRWGGVIALDEGGPVGWVAEELDRRGQAVFHVKPAALARASAQFAEAVRAKRVTHLGDERLGAAVSRAEVRRMSSGGWTWDRRSAVDVAPLVAASLAFAGAVGNVEPERPAVY